MNEIKRSVSTQARLAKSSSTVACGKVLQSQLAGTQVSRVFEINYTKKFEVLISQKYSFFFFMKCKNCSNVLM